MESENLHDAFIKSFFEIGITGIDFLEIQILLALFLYRLGGLSSTIRRRFCSTGLSTIRDWYAALS